MPRREWSSPVHSAEPVLSSPLESADGGHWRGLRGNWSEDGFGYMDINMSRREWDNRIMG